MIAPGTDPKQVTDEQIQQVADDLRLFCKANKISQKAVAKATGYSPGVISEFARGTYNGDRGQVALDMEDWLVEEEQRRSSQDCTHFVWTNVARTIQAVGEYCLDQRSVGLVYGPQTSGIGKTTAMRAIHQELGPRRSAFVTIDKADANPTALLRKILGGLRLDESGSNTRRMHRIVDALQGRSHLLLIDQIHNLRFAKQDKPLYHLMDIFEATQTAQLWAGTTDMVEYLMRQQSKSMDEPLAQIRRRIFPCVDLMEVFNRDGGGDPLYSVDQVREMFGGFKLKLTAPAARFLTALAHQPDAGGIGICVQIMQYASHLARTRDCKSIDVDLLKEALMLGLTTHRASKLIVDVEQPEPAVKVG